MMKISLSELIDYLQQGREIEFSFQRKNYFMSYIDDEIDGEEKYFIWDSERQLQIFCGTLHNLLKYQFAENISFESQIEQFNFQYIL